jgi:nitrogen regulatory protein P-II 1
MHNVVLAFLAAAAALGIIHRILARVRRKYRTRMITCVIRPEQLNDVTSALANAQLMTGMTITDVRGFGRQRGDKEPSTNETLPKLKIETLVRELDLEKTVKVVSDTLRTGQIGDGKIVVFKTSSTMRVRTGEKGLSAL